MWISKIKLERIYSKQNKLFQIDNDDNEISFPTVSSVSKETKVNKRIFRNVHSNEIHSLCNNPINTNYILSGDEYKIFLWDINSTVDEVFNPVDIDPNTETEKMTM